MCFHLGMTNGFIWNYKLPSERFATTDEYEELLHSIHNIINQDDGKYIYVHKVFIFVIIDSVVIL